MSVDIVRGCEKIDKEIYDTLYITGLGISENNFETQNLKVDGSLKCNGNIKCQKFKCNGSAKFFNILEMNEFYCDGSVMSSGTEQVIINHIFCNGAAKFSSDVKAQVIDVDGLLTLMNNNNLISEKIFCDGSIIVNGNINAKFINADGFVYARNIYSDEIYIRATQSSMSKKLKKTLFRKYDSININEIVGNHIEVSNIKAEKITGKDIVIGENCIITSIECSGTIKIHKDAVIENLSGNFVKLDD